ncbi:hypothetical protein E3N88_18709 [Mikania micrantha]|uniref:Uncharacterized protein n=1 Tax=Mikania micrantha TaxID=192012 RepID=A0A5N6NN65_9ASTR|nr:hypothetical protein E3N88_18709 [Mikania micrantha]
MVSGVTNDDGVGGRHWGWLALSVADGGHMVEGKNGVLLILTLIFFFLGFQWYSSYEEAIEATEESFNWVLLITPLLLLFAVKWLSSVENPEKFFGFGLSPWERRRRQAYQMPAEGSSPWGVAALILMVLVLMQFHSTVVEGWF